MNLTLKCCVLIVAATIVALALRLPRLAQRPMHGDEAVHADKFGDLLEGRGYKYDPKEYHGPTLNYLTLIPAWLSSAGTYAQVNEFTVRVVPVFFGVLLVVLVLFVADGLGRQAAILAAILTAISPAMVFYSRYYIQEMLLICFTFGAIVFGYRYSLRHRMIWALLTGVCLGLMHATKETCIIAFGSLLLAFGFTLLMRQREDRIDFDEQIMAIKPGHFAAMAAGGLIVSMLLHSSFFANPEGILDSVRTYATYFDRAGNNRMHEQPWHYYLKMLIYSRFAGGPIWSEGVIVLLAAVGFVAVFKNKALPAVNIDFLRFIAFYTLTMTVLYSVIRYKTPWCMLGFLHGMILLAGVGAVVLVRLVPNVVPRLIILFLLIAASVLLFWQSCRGNFIYEADSRNPYVYAHPTKEVFEIVDLVEQYAEAHPDGRRMPIQVICPGDDYWPLPWYLRSFPNVGWWNRVVTKDEQGNEILPAPVILASPAVEADLVNRFYDNAIPFEKRQMYLRMFEAPYYMWLRPAIKISGFVRKDLWEARQAMMAPDPNDLIRKSAR